MGIYLLLIKENYLIEVPLLIFWTVFVPPYSLYEKYK